MAQLHKERILVIDDEEIMRVSCARILHEKFEVDGAASGHEGLALFAQGNYALVLLDLKMPGMEGAEVFNKIREHNPAQPVLIMTGYGTTEQSDSLILEGVAVIEKPFTPDALMKKIDEVLRSTL